MQIVVLYQIGMAYSICKSIMHYKTKPPSIVENAISIKTSFKNFSFSFQPKIEMLIVVM
jgi:hypothetical protein